MLWVTAVTILAVGCQQAEQKFPDQIPAIVQSLNVFHMGILNHSPGSLDSVSVDPELYAALMNVLGDDSLAILTRRIHNPIDSAHIYMTVAAVDYASRERSGKYELELFMKARGDRFWIVAHRLSHSPR